MGTRHCGSLTRRRATTRHHLNFDFRVSCFALLLLAGCGAPGEPQPRRPPIPTAVTDLSARQLGDGVLLTFTLPHHAVNGQRLTEPPAVEILRATAPESGAPKKAAASLVFTIPSAAVETYFADGRIQFTDPVPPEEVRDHPDERYLYIVRTRLSNKNVSADSNSVFLRLYPAPERITGVQARVTESAIELSWPAPTRATTGAPFTTVSGYRIYRGEINPASSAAAAEDVSKAEFTSPLNLLASPSSTSYSDAQFDFGRTYLYSIRLIMPAGTGTVESADSLPLVITPRDVFPPAPPKGLEVIFVPASPGIPAHAELSWEISPETDLAGYHVYRSEQEDTRGALLTPDLLLAPAFRDMPVVLGHHYFYRVTAVDRAGNESEPGNPEALQPQQNP